MIINVIPNCACVISANKRKKAGSPDGSDIPLEGQLTSFENYHQPPIVDVIRGPTVEELIITDHDMIAVSS